MKVGSISRMYASSLLAVAAWYRMLSPDWSRTSTTLSPSMSRW